MSNVMHFIHGGGFVMYPLLFLALAAVAVSVERLIAFAQYGAIPSSLLAEVLSLARAGRYDEAKQRCETSRGPLAACLYVVLNHRTRPTREIERLVEETGQDYFITLERMLPALDTMATVSPLLGLLGTITGMIGAFNAIALQTHHGSNDAVLAGVGEALYATATGLIVAVICFAFYNYFTARYRTLTAQTEQGATKLLNILVEGHHTERAGHEIHENNVLPPGKGEANAIQTAA